MESNNDGVYGQAIGLPVDEQGIQLPEGPVQGDGRHEEAP